MVGNSHIYIPSTPCKIENSNIVGPSSGWDESGVMHIDWIRRDVDKIYLHWNAMSASELNAMKTVLQGRNIVFWYPYNGIVKRITAYVGECTCEYYSDALGDEAVYTNVEMHVIQTFDGGPST